MPRNVTTAIIAGDPQLHEIQHVHTVYDQIASHFSSTRYKAWLDTCHAWNETDRFFSLGLSLRHSYQTFQQGG